MRLPKQGEGERELFEVLARFQENDMPWRDGRTWADDLIADLRESVDTASVTPEVFESMLRMAGVSGTTLPERMAEINEVLNALPVPLRERLLVEYLNELYQPAH